MYTGRANISIPLHSIKLKDYSYDIQLFYNTEGNKPELPVSSVGLGWSITGGQIHRIKNGLPTGYIGFDERGTLTDYVSKTGYNWDSTANLQQYYYARFDGGEGGREPNLDEFVINIGNINASFYMYYVEGKIQTKIASQHSPYFRVTDVKVEKLPEILFIDDHFQSPGGHFDTQLFIKPDTAITEITVVDTDGVTYVFGGSIETVDLSLEYRQDPLYSTYYNYYGTALDCNFPISKGSTHYPNEFSSYLVGSASTWHIKKIILPNQENILFEYKKGNVNIAEKTFQYTYSRFDWFSHAAIFNSWSMPPSDICDDNTNYMNFLRDKSYDIVYPSTLTKIEASNGEIVDFTSTSRNDLATDGYYNLYYYQLRDNYGFLTRRIKSNKSYYYKIDKIQTPNDCIDFYYTNDSTQRLKLDSLHIASIGKYKFSYNPERLPEFTEHWLTDNWGYYNGISHEDLVNSSQGFDSLYARRTPNSAYVKAEILEKIVYPTGGETRLEYELHDFSKVSKQYPFTIESRNGKAGGVRVKRITMSDNNDPTKNIVTDYLYVNENGTSSGILLADPQYVTSDYRCYYKTSTYINWVDKSHMAYSRVVEQHSDGSKTVYSFVDNNDVMDEPSLAVYSQGPTNDLHNRLTSRWLDRGLVKSTKYYDSSNTLLQEEQFTYNVDNTNYLKIIDRNSLGVDLLVRVSANKIYTYYPYLKTKTTIQYTPQGSVTEFEEYDYNYFRLLTSHSKVTTNASSNNSETYVERRRYLCDVLDGFIPPNNFSVFPNSGPFFLLAHVLIQTNQWSLLTEKTVLRNGQVIASEGTYYKPIGDNNHNWIVKKSAFHLEIQTPINSYTPYYQPASQVAAISDSRCIVRTLYDNYDKYGNPLYVTTKDNRSRVYLWSYKGQYPIAEIELNKATTYNQAVSAILSQLSINSVDALSDLAEPNETKLKDGSLQNALPNTLVTTYTYKPFVGITSKTTPDGTTTYYEYDSFGRLKWTYIKDIDGNRQYLEGYKMKYKN
jgi:YD repeat-containing protein